jgi:hypothetical protein
MYNTEVPSCNHCCHGRAISITYSECVSVTLSIQHAKCTCHSVVLSVASLAPHYLINSTIFIKKVTEHKACILTFSTKLSKTFPIIRIIQQQIVINIKTSSCKVSITVVRF